MPRAGTARRGVEETTTPERPRAPGPPTPRGLQSHVQAALVNSAGRGRAIGAARAIGQLSERFFPVLRRRYALAPSGSSDPPTPHPGPQLKHAHPGPLAAIRLCKHACMHNCRGPPLKNHHPPHLETREHPQPRESTPSTPRQEEGGRERKEARGGKACLPSSTTKAWPGTAAEPRGSVCNLQTSRLAPPAADKSERGVDRGPPTRTGRLPQTSERRCGESPGTRGAT